MNERSKALKTLVHVLMYLNGRDGHEEVRTIFLKVRGPYDFRRVGHKRCTRCELFSKIGREGSAGGRR